MIEGSITLIHPGETEADDEKTPVFAEINPVGRNEFNDAGQAGYKAQYQFVIWAAEYDEQPEAVFNEKRLTIYRTYGPRSDDKIELYAAERIGNGRKS